jgi:hypothetical protein
MHYRIFMIFLVIVSTHQAFGQQVSGRVFAGETDSVIRYATITNLNSRAVTVSGTDGRYIIQAAEGDSLLFSAVGYIPDTVLVEFHMLHTQFDIALPQRIISLAVVRVTSDYSADSLARRQYYRHIYRQPGITGNNRPQYGFGISISPISHFSLESKQKRLLKKRLLIQERDAYIDLAFPVEWVQRLTGLQGDSLRLFMYKYRPSYDFCRGSDRTRMLVYINDKLLEFRKPATSKN